MSMQISSHPSIFEIQDLYKNKQASVSEVVKIFLQRIEQIDSEINAFFKTTPELAEQEAKKLDQILKSLNWEDILVKYPLFGVPFSVKAIIQIEGEIFNASSKIMDGFTAPYSSTVYEKIKKAGGVVVGINNMDQWAMGSSGEFCDYGVTKNPIDKTRVPGGSSSGPVAAVSSGQVVFSLGTDTGGSIRQPASFCNVVGLKPTYGAVSRWGVMPMASSFDQVGAITNNVRDNILVNSLLYGEDKKDQTSIDSQETKQKMLNLLETKVDSKEKKVKIGLPKEFYIDGINPQIKQALEELKTKLEKLGYEFAEVSLPLNKYAIAVYYMIMSVEVASNLERIDGIRYARQGEYKELYTEHRGQFFGDEAKRRILLGTYASSAGYYDAYYNYAQKVRELARQDYQKVFQEVDLLLVPTTPEFPFKIGEKSSDDPIKMYLSDVFTCGINPVRIPGLTVPLGLFETDNAETKLPTGCQILGPELAENRLYQLALDVEEIINN